MLRAPGRGVFAGCVLMLILSACQAAIDLGDDGAAGSGGAPAEEPDTVELAGITARHNDVRAAALPAPDPPLDPLQWSATAAEVAQAWAAQCVWNHNTGRGDLGENLYASAGQEPAAHLPVEAWSAEAVDYDYASNTCAGDCGHYTQIVWRQSEGLGCAYQHCTSGSPFAESSTWDYWVCNYDPPGNLNGARPY